MSDNDIKNNTHTRNHDDLREKALNYHSLPFPGKISVMPSKSCEQEDELSLAYTPGVAVPVLEIAKNPELAYQYTSKGNLVAVITDGSAVLGLGNVGALAGKPVMEGKGVLFKQFAGIDVFDLEVTAESQESFIETVVNVAPTFGGINLEDIAAPQCFEIEKVLKERLDIPVFHDDQHGTAIIIAAGLSNALEIQSKSLDEIKIVCLGAGAAGIAAMRLLVALGVKTHQINLIDRKGVVHAGRKDLNIYKQEFATQTDDRTLADAMQKADVLIGVSGSNLIAPEMVASMADKPIIFALSNPEPEIAPDVALSVRDDLIMATGRSDYPNQVNNALVFPFIFRGALDVRASTINTAMAIAAVKALANLTKLPVSEEVLQTYDMQSLTFGKDYIIPKPFDPRLISTIPPAVAQAAIDSGVARTPYRPYKY
ncbi:MAG: malate dehydrogenase [gamma proteobacterium symbiont of Lucinoma myriamae]|nr:malate dehydrogenase [gamma proteobacterium symbiont of Lucinoma myriamae]MCU7817788.1 malate dehydrogenase [gamma proteobacterium symbiont of Lucinoma myriamae]MCU7832814.1 malate dehydrogenase [gamma proteobacterium symbiont of Lucinoma myriamae]